MNDAEKLKLIDHIIADAWEYTIGENRKDGYFEGVVIGIAAVLGVDND